MELPSSAGGKENGIRRAGTGYGEAGYGKTGGDAAGFHLAQDTRSELMLTDTSAEVSTGHGNSALYSKKDMAAVGTTWKAFDTWDGCELRRSILWLR